MMNKLKILLIEDDEIERLKFQRVMASCGNHKVIAAQNGEEALEILEKIELPNAIVLDLNMPRINGIEFLSILKNNEALKYIPIVIMSTSSNLNDIKTCFEIGIAGYMTKPLKYEEYKAKVEALCQYWSLNELIAS